MKKSGGMRRSRRGFGIYIHRTLRRVKPNCQMSKKAMLVMDSFMHDVLQRVAEVAAQLVVIQKRKTLICQDIETAVKLLLSGELMLHAVSEGTKAYARYTGSTRV
ncbi:histone H2B-like [Eriocheir sinensis]|uniref:histone H2B-like n=1 Tax=Eriocheir sinensis TaxID=95602 RepID=UPI0021C7E67C|nr:histone H2B-like [Eriocheir sinensis]